MKHAACSMQHTWTRERRWLLSLVACTVYAMPQSCVRSMYFATLEGPRLPFTNLHHVFISILGIGFRLPPFNSAFAKGTKSFQLSGFSLKCAADAQIVHSVADQYAESADRNCTIASHISDPNRSSIERTLR